MPRRYASPERGYFKAAFGAARDRAQDRRHCNYVSVGYAALDAYCQASGRQRSEFPPMPPIVKAATICALRWYRGAPRGRGVRSQSLAETLAAARRRFLYLEGR